MADHGLTITGADLAAMDATSPERAAALRMQLNWEEDKANLFPEEDRDKIKRERHLAALDAMDLAEAKRRSGELAAKIEAEEKANAASRVEELKARKAEIKSETATLDEEIKRLTKLAGG